MRGIGRQGPRVENVCAHSSSSTSFACVSYLFAFDYLFAGDKDGVLKVHMLFFSSSFVFCLFCFVFCLFAFVCQCFASFEEVVHSLCIFILLVSFSFSSSLLLLALPF